MVIALAGRRIDAPGAGQPRFPPQCEGLVASRLRDFFQEQKASALVSSAACGADLLAQEIAREFAFRRLVLLPFAPSRFRETSVADRPGDWGPRFDRVLAAIRDLVILNYSENDLATYSRLNRAILDRAAALAADLHQPLCAVAVWDGRSRGSRDVTEQFLLEARARSPRIAEISTLG